MAKDKFKSGMKNKHLHARISFLHKAATFLTEQHSYFSEPTKDMRAEVPAQVQSNGSEADPQRPESPSISQPSLSRIKSTWISVQKPSSGGLPIHLSSHISQVARKSQIRLVQEVKHSICKRCATIQVEGETCRKFTENLCKGAKKQHADVLVQECGVCGAKKRWPVGAQKQGKNTQRKALKRSGQDRANESQEASKSMRRDMDLD